MDMFHRIKTVLPFPIVDAADKLVELATAEGQTSQDARLTMGDAVSVTANGGILSVDGSITCRAFIPST